MNPYLQDDIYRYIYNKKWEKVNEEVDWKIILKSYVTIPQRVFRTTTGHFPMMRPDWPVEERASYHPYDSLPLCPHCDSICMRLSFNRASYDYYWTLLLSDKEIYPLNPLKHKCNNRIPLPDRYWFTYPTKEHLKKAILAP